MSVSLLSASTARLDFGNPAILNTLPSAISIAFTITPTGSTANGNRFLSKWSADSITAGQAFLWYQVDTDEIAFLLHSNLPAFYFSKKTTAVNMAGGTTYRIVGTFQGGSPPVLAIWVNGVSQTLTSIDASNVNVLQDTTTNVQVARETVEGVNGVDGVYSEVAIWLEVVPDWVARGYGQGMSPRFYRNNGILYAPCWNTASASLLDQWGGNVGTNSGGTTATHPAVIYPV